MTSYQQAFRNLNAAQRLAVEAIDGPVLVIAGPGTGKTQLLSTRIAHILATTDTLPHNILCLTFTDSAAQNMRDRLASMIGQAAYDVSISTYHAFGADLIRRFPDYFVEFGDLRPVDELGIDSIFRDILADLPFSNPLKFAEIYLADIKALVSDAKRALLTPGDLRRVAEHNDAFLQKAQPVVSETLQHLVRVDKQTLGLLQKLRSQLAGMADIPSPPGDIIPIPAMLLAQLGAAIEASEESGKTQPLTKWKNTWLTKNDKGQFIVDGQKTNQKLRAAADIYEHYLAELATRGLYDYDDMILRAVRALGANADLRFTLQEQYLYLLLDEFQDTNGAQLRLVQLLTDNPVYEGRPNVLAVGDDDQAIYAFQGADYSHMLEFKRLYRDVTVVSLTENYRSHQNILDLARHISGQIEERLDAGKSLVAAASPKTAVIERREAKSDIGQFAWTAKKIKQLIDEGTPAGDIAVLAPKHKYLEPLVAFLHEHHIPVRYEKRENVLDDPAINQLLRMSELTLLLADGDKSASNALWAEVLSFPFWNLPTSTIWEISWQANDTHRDWTEVLMREPAVRPIVLFFVRLAQLANAESLENMLDCLMGLKPVELKETDCPSYASPFYSYYFSELQRVLSAHPSPAVLTSLRAAGVPQGPPPAEQGKSSFWNLLTNLTVLRERLRDYRPEQSEPLRLGGFVQFAQAHRAADIKILNTSPYQEAEQAVQLMTTYKAKGQEFGAVFVLAVTDQAWGNKARAQGNRLSLPANLQFIRYAGASSDERLRLFYVAITRAKSHLYLVNYTATFAGKSLTRLKYLAESADDGAVASPLLPPGSQIVLPAEEDTVPTNELAAYWQQRHETALTEPVLRTLLKTRLERFQLSPTHVNSFIDVEKQGPMFFFMNTILRFPQAPSPAGEFGSAMHAILEWIHYYRKTKGELPTHTQTLGQFTKDLQSRALSVQDARHFLERGAQALHAYLAQRGHTVQAQNIVEMNFSNEGIFIGQAHMGGKIDKLIVNEAQKTIVIVDYKTGAAHKTWDKTTKLQRYKQQLYLYKSIVERARRFKTYKVADAYVEFIEPDETGKIQELHLQFDDQEQALAERLAASIWQHIHKLSFPGAEQYGANLKGIEQFEDDLLKTI